MNHRTIRKKTLALGIVALLSGPFAGAGGTDRVVVTPKATSDALINPGMGWVYYHFDNSNWNYGGGTAPGDTLDWFPGCSTVYFRLPWRDLEPTEGEFRWDVIDSVAQPWIAAGKQIAFRFTCSESAYEFAVPEWLPASGAKGSFCQFRKTKDDPGRRVYEPDYLDPVFLEKFGNFLKAAARRWNGNPSVAFIDVGSFGMWGEGHTGSTSKLSPEKTKEIALVHAQLHKRCFPDTPVVISDDVAGGWNRNPDDPLLVKFRELGIGLRDDSIMVSMRPKQWFHAGWARLFVKAGLPVVVESRHFFADKGLDCWYDGGLYESTVAYQASFQAIHWWPDDFLKKKRAEIERTNLRLGYRFVLKEASWPQTVPLGEACEIGAEWVNVGVAPPLEELVASWTLLDGKGTVVWTSVDETFDFRHLPPTLEDGEKPVARTSRVRFGWDWPSCGKYYGTGDPAIRHDGAAVPCGPRVPTLRPGLYSLCVSIGRCDGTPRIALPLDSGVGASRRYRLGTIRIASPRSASGNP